MTIPKGTTLGLASIVVIIALILPKTTVQAVSPNRSVANNVSKPIKPDNTIRVDPLDNFKKYREGFDITNKHYWSSVFFSGVYGYAIGVFWLLCGMVCGFILATINFCCQSDGETRTKKILPCNYKTCDFLPISLAISFMILIMVASGFVYVGSIKFHSQATTSLNVIIKIADDASKIIRNATRALEDIHENMVDLGITAEVSGNFNFMTKKLDDAADNIKKKTEKNRHTISRAFKIVFIITIVIISWNIVAVPILSVFRLHMFWRAFYLFIILCWLMIAICWIIFGLYFFLENFSNDTCTVLYNFEENPYNNSLTSILPCDELRAAKSFLHEIAVRFSTLVNKVNSNLESMIPNHVYLCNPFSTPPEYLYQPELCPPNSIQIGDIPKVLKRYTCFNDNDEKCSSDDFMNGGIYKIVDFYASSIQNLLNMYPSMENLVGCQLVKDAFSIVLLKHCNPLKKFARMTWVAMVFVVVLMMIYVVLWTIKACQKHHYHHSKGLM